MQSGGQPGNQNAVKAKRWQKALERALARASSKDVDAGLDTIADQVVSKAAAGDKDAWKEIGDRMDGKPTQEVDASLKGSLGIYQPVAIPVHDREPDPLVSAAGAATGSDQKGVG